LRVFLSGGSGFIGRNLQELLGSKLEIRAPSRSELDLTDSDAVQRYFENEAFDAVIHSAVRPGHRAAMDRTGQLYANTRMFFNLVRVAPRWKKMVVLSSGLIYDERHYLPKMREEYFGVHVPADEAGFSKYIVGTYIEQARAITELRPFSVYGKYENYSIRFISNAICKALFRLPITIKQNRRYDFIAVEDVVKGIDHFLRNDGSVELLEVAEMVRDISGNDVPILVKQPGLGVEYSGNNERLKSDRPTFQPTSLKAGVTRLIRWYESRMDSIDRNELLFDR
jgi:UDP-glucose 4-epimerase